MREFNFISGVYSEATFNFRVLPGEWPSEKDANKALFKAQAEAIFEAFLHTIPAGTLDALGDIFFRENIQS